jgi:hypothetical protein
MNHFSPVPAGANDPRLSSPEAADPNANPALQARRQKLRRIVAWVVGGAALLMCAGLVRGAIRSHSAANSGSSPRPPELGASAVGVAVTPALPNPGSDSAVPAPTPSGVAPKTAKQAFTHARATAKPAKHAAVAKSVRH